MITKIRLPERCLGSLFLFFGFIVDIEGLDVLEVWGFWDYSLRMASAGDMRVTKYEGPTSIRIEAMARQMLIRSHAERERCTGTWST